MIDLHCHILPGIDDGPVSQDESLAMARRAEEDGIHTIVATPHTLNGIHLNPAREIISKVDALQEILLNNHIQIHLCAASDVHLCPHILELVASGDALTINDAKKYILLELPSQAIPKGVKDEIFELKLNGITPIITHPERNAIIQHDLNILYDLVSMGAISQVTAMSITGDFGVFVKRAAEIMLKKRLVHIIASDAHGADKRPPALSRAVEHTAEILGSYEEAMRMVTEVPAAILSGAMPDFPEPMHTKHKDRFFTNSF
ncbi:MAG: tyrosine protein phosphatase [Deltaproteobacteria bacterium]|nr:tyrosine protein phosphatase [Deltaproteobacteria bacterium]